MLPPQQQQHSVIRYTHTLPSSCSPSYGGPHKAISFILSSSQICLYPLFHLKHPLSHLHTSGNTTDSEVLLRNVYVPYMLKNSLLIKEIQACCWRRDQRKLVQGLAVTVKCMLVCDQPHKNTNLKYCIGDQLFFQTSKGLTIEINNLNTLIIINNDSIVN